MEERGPTKFKIAEGAIDVARFFNFLLFLGFILGVLVLCWLKTAIFSWRRNGLWLLQCCQALGVVLLPVFPSFRSRHFVALLAEILRDLCSASLILKSAYRLKLDVIVLYPAYSDEYLLKLWRKGRHTVAGIVERGHEKRCLVYHLDYLFCRMRTDRRHLWRN